ncbi:MAG: hypothetical protein AB1567_12695 [bacterium]
MKFTEFFNSKFCPKRIRVKIISLTHKLELVIRAVFSIIRIVNFKRVVMA